MPSRANVQKVIANVRKGLKKEDAPEQLADDLVRFVAARCGQIVREFQPSYRGDAVVSAAMNALREQFVTQCSEQIRIEFDL